MTNATEARLAREAELCYATVALSTDYDCWHQSEADVTVDAVLQVMRANVRMAQEIVRHAARRLAGPPGCACKDALKGAIMTAPERIPPAARKRLELLIGRYLPGSAPKRAKRVKRARSR